MNKVASIVLTLIITSVLIFRFVNLNHTITPTVAPIELLTESAVEVSLEVTTASTSVIGKSVFTINDFNKLNKKELMEFPGIGEVIAQNILDYIAEHGPFQTFDDIMKVKGIGTKKLEKILANLP